MPDALLFDSETTGTKEPEIVEAAWCYVPPLADFKAGDELPIRSYRYRPSKPIDLGALATHHIMDEDLAECEPWSSASLPACDYLVGHNIDFDWGAIGKPDIKRICTLALARALWPAVDSHKQGALLYLLERPSARTLLKGAHSAENDVFVCRIILGHILDTLPVKPESWADLWALSEVARVPTIMPVGKHKSLPMADVPRDYKDWFLRQPDVDPYLRKALES
jgi:exodeoxyribonuclease X